MTITSISEQEAALGALFDDPEFYEIHRRMSPFNLFEAVGATTAELRHSNFLAYLLSPRRPHGLGSKPLAALLRSILGRLPADNRPIMALELIANDLDDAVVHRERDNIDILIEIHELKFVVAIENKVKSKAGDGQLKRYSDYLAANYSGYRRLLVFLTPDATEPDHAGYVPYDYAEVAATLETLVSQSLEPVPEETQLIIRHYIEMVRRHIVEDERLVALGVRLYERHREALDFIIKHRPQPDSLLRVVAGCVEGVQGLEIDSEGASILRFFPSAWDEGLKVIKGDPTKWSRTGRGLLFEVKNDLNKPGQVRVVLMIGPVASEIRKRIYEAATAQPQLFVRLVKPMGEKWTTIFCQDFLTVPQAKGLTFEQQATNVRLGWSSFQGSQLQELIAAIIRIDEEIAQHH